MKTFNYWKCGFLLVVLIPALIYGWRFAARPAWYSQLAMPMTIHLDRPSGAVPIKAVWLAARPWHDDRWETVIADDKVAKIWIEGGALEKAYSFDSDTIDYRVPGDDCRSELGITLWYAQHHHLLILAELADGKFVGSVANIPDARTTREMRATLP